MRRIGLLARSQSRPPLCTSASLRSKGGNAKCDVRCSTMQALVTMLNGGTAMNTRLLATLLAVAISWLGASTGLAQTSAHIMMSPADLKWADVPSLPPGAKIAVIEGPPTEAVPFTFRLKFPANYKIPAHWHPAIEHVTVISGALNL